MTFIVGYARTPFSKLNGALSTFSAVQLGSHAIVAALSQAGVGPQAVDVVYGGQVLQAGCGQNPARQAAVKAGIPLATPAMTLNAVCLSGMEAISAGDRLIRSGEANIVVAFGQESMSQSPHAWVGSRKGTKFGPVTLVDTMEFDGLVDAFERQSMGSSTEKYLDRNLVTREEMDRFAFRSHMRALEANEFMAEEISPITFSTRQSEQVIAIDDGIRRDATIEALARLSPAFAPDGTITAGNSSQLTDGAAAVVLMSEEALARFSGKPLAKIISTALVSGPDYSLHAQPANAINAALKKIARSSNDLVSVEINEAFAAVGVASTKILDIDPALVNKNGGAIALGHPIGASGTRIVGHLARQAISAPSGSLLAAGICGGGGQGSAVILESI